MHTFKSMTLVCMLVFVAIAMAEDAAPSEEPPKMFEPDSAILFERFDEGWKERWQPSANDKFKDGRWVVGDGLLNNTTPGDLGLIVKDAAKHHAISTKFKELFDPANGELVVQYEVRLHRHHECGGAYIKVLTEDSKFSPKTFHDKTPYAIMFGPDKCGSNNKVHFIFRLQNPVSKKYVEHHLTTPPTIMNDRHSHLYTLVVRPDNTFELFIDSESKRKGSLMTDFDPPVNPPKEIDDPRASQPADWVTEAKIPDPEAKKPDDWDEDAPKEIPNESASKPAGWMDDEEPQIPDPDAEKPDDWDDEDDGEWEAPLIDNPKCSVGCGEWKRPMMPNPDYKGKWRAPLIDNPKYKGPWKPPKVPNPDYYELDDAFAKIDRMGGLGVELWTMQDEIQFDNIYIGHDAEEASRLAEASWRVRFERQKEADIVPPKGIVQRVNDFMNQYPMVVVLVVIIICVGALFVFSYCCVQSPATDDDDDDDDLLTSRASSGQAVDSEPAAPKDSNEPSEASATPAADDAPPADDDTPTNEEKAPTPAAAGTDQGVRQRKTRKKKSRKE